MPHQLHRFLSKNLKTQTPENFIQNTELKSSIFFFSLFISKYEYIKKSICGLRNLKTTKIEFSTISNQQVEYFSLEKGN